MWQASHHAPRAQDALHIARTDKHLHRTGSMTACALASIAACLLIFSAASQNVAYAYGLGLAKSEWSAYVLAAASAGASILGPCAWLAVFGRRVAFSRRMVALALAVGCLAYAATCSLGFVATSRDTGIAEQSQRALAAKERAVLIEAAQAELRTLKGQRTGIVERRAEITELLAKLVQSPISERSAVKPDSQAAAFGYYIRAAGYPVEDDTVGTWLNLGMVAFLELAAALSLTVAAALYPSTQRKPQISPVAAVLPAGTQVPAAPLPAAGGTPERRETDKDDEPPPPARKVPRRAGRPRAVTAKDVLHRLAECGGTMSGSLATIGELIGSKSRATTHGLLHQLASAGSITLQTGRQGCRVALA